ncbi:hypothetical protein BHE90_014001 [Fusarium euwallaceae]|uniref:Uncharacterized protein n=3 Tax=Fusarium solani species complex TaxID=232080 RepID=A0A3M2RYC1_9HYPO|nr:hypothetical protein CDV36_010421 [Fusarium kuroshium]RSL79004.1 hypothetical protein CEP51_007708 [Fusarium floridanum]RTE71602.1 hypothetical protein BHE90_014001 [Fusarium euwallaceae]
MTQPRHSRRPKIQAGKLSFEPFNFDSRPFYLAKFSNSSASIAFQAHRTSINPPQTLPPATNCQHQQRSKMACGTSSLVNRNGPGSAATSIAESILKPAEATGTKTKCIECGDYECCCIPCTIL